MGIKIRYVAPAAAGASFAYSVERQIDGAFFDFRLHFFRSLGEITANAVTAPLTYYDGAVSANFNYTVGGEMYIVRIHRVDMGGQIVIELPLTTLGEEDHVSATTGGPYMEPSYRLGKKFLDGKVIEAKCRLTFYGNDGFTIHTATLWEDGTTSCNCPKWGPKVDGQRRCRHSDQAATLTTNVDETGERPEPPAPTVPRDTNPFRRPTRAVDT